MPKTLLLFLFLVFTLSACSPKVLPSVSVPTQSVAKNKILFLSLEVTKSDLTPTFKVINHQLVDGRIKKSTSTNLHFPEHFKIIFNDNTGKVINQVTVENPLTRSVEVSDENGTFTRHRLDLDKASLAIRIQYLNKISSISIFDETGKLISTLEVSI